jgi:hypothetical protein
MQMKPYKVICLVIIILSLISFSEVIAQTQLKSSTMGTAGGKTESASFKMWSSIGQAVEAGTASSASFHLHGNLAAITRDLEQPSISGHTPPSSPHAAGSDIAIQATASDNINIDNCMLHYREGGASSFSATEMTESEGVYSGTIPGASVGSKGVEYYIRAEDVNANTRESDLFSVRVALSESGITNSAAQPSGSAQSAYRMISLPLDATNKKPADVLEEELGTYNPTVWRFYELLADQTYREHPNTGNMNPGKAFWLIVKNAEKVISTGAGNTVQTSSTYSVALHAGWNLVGNPFNFNIPQTHVSLQNSAALDIRSYNGSWNNFNGSLAPFQGYAVYTEQATNLLIDPILTGMGKLKSTEILAEKEGEWIIDIEARSQDAVDTDNRAVSLSKASDSWDTFDRPEPPVIGDYVSLYFPHAEWEKMSTKYCVDARAKLEDGAIWDFEIRTNIKGNVSLGFKGIEKVPAEFEVWFVDQSNKQLYNLREQNIFEVNVSTKNARRLMLAVGKTEFINQNLNDYKMIPTEFSLDQNYPNPFNPTTTIRYGLPKDVNVHLKVYNLLGQEVTTLMNNVAMKAGYHTIEWDGLNNHGDTVASGLYIYHIQAGNFSSVKKMILVR